jgi:glucosamine-6-phosphate deaminase
LGEFVEVAGDATDLKSEIKRLNDKLKVRTVSVCFAGIGENAHLAFNDPPADFETRDPYIVVNLDEACRKQQLGEGWFPSLDAVPKQAVSMSIRQIMASQHLLITVPDERKADAVQKAIEGPLTPHCPASILRLHPDCIIALDPPAASRLSVRL